MQCGRCDRYICPRDLVHTPGGIRCTDCAELRRPPMYELGASDLLKAGLAAGITALPLGFLGALLLPPQRFAGFFTLAIALLLGFAAGSIVSAVIERVSGKRGTAVQLIAATSIVAAAALRLVIGNDLDLIARDVAGAVAAVAAIAYAWSRLR